MMTSVHKKYFFKSVTYTTTDPIPKIVIIACLIVRPAPGLLHLVDNVYIFLVKVHSQRAFNQTFNSHEFSWG